MDLADRLSASFSGSGRGGPAGMSTRCTAEMGYSQRVYDEGLACLAEVTLGLAGVWLNKTSRIVSSVLTRSQHLQKEREPELKVADAQLC